MCINYPSLFSLSHPIDEIRPILLKSSNSSINFFNDLDMKIIFAAWNDDLVLFYDSKNGIHIICILREVSCDELNYVSQLNHSLSTTINMSTIGHQSRQQCDLNATGRFLSGIEKNNFINVSNITPCSNK